MSSDVWNHYDKIPGTHMATCLLCNKEYSFRTTITNLKKHLNYMHSNVLNKKIKPTSFKMKSIKKSENEERSVYEEVIEGSSSSQLDMFYPTAGNKTVKKPSASTLQQCNQQAIAAHKPCEMNQEPKEYIDKKLLQMITQDYQPFSIVEDNGFRSFVEALNPSYELPSRKFISGTLIPVQYLECKTEIKCLVHKATKVCLTVECWTSAVMDAYLAVTAHFLIDFEMKTILLHCEHLSGSHTADDLAETLEAVASEWDITDKITLAVSDNAENIASAIQKTGWPFFGCFLHKLNLVIEQALQIIEFILEKVKTIVVYFKNSDEATEALIKYQTDIEKKSQSLKLIQSVPTRWNSVFYMLERFSYLQRALQSVLQSLGGELPIITVEIWEAIRQVCMILKPFEEITQIMSGTHYLTASLAIVIVDGLKNVITVMKTKHIIGVAEEFLTTLEQGLYTYFPDNEIEDNMILGVCTFLDPRFKIHAFLDDGSVKDASSQETCHRTRRAHIIKDHVLELLKTKLRKQRKTPAFEIVIISAPNASTCTNVEEVEPLSVWGKLDKRIAAITPSVDDIPIKAKKELDMFLNEDVVQRNTCPLAWWKSHAYVYPNLAEIFNEHCHIVVTSVECERIFSKAGNIETQKRSQLSRKRTAQLVFLKSNEAYCK